MSVLPQHCACVHLHADDTWQAFKTVQVALGKGAGKKVSEVMTNTPITGESLLQGMGARDLMIDWQGPGEQTGRAIEISELADSSKITWYPLLENSVPPG